MERSCVLSGTLHTQHRAQGPPQTFARPSFGHLSLKLEVEGWCSCGASVAAQHCVLGSSALRRQETPA